MKDWFSWLAQALVDYWMAMVPRARPGRAAIENCKIVAHRGAHDDGPARENTMAAFEAARAAGVWGIETDIRWTADLVPVLSHDPDTARIFGKKVAIGEVTFAELRAAVPGVPSLAELVERFGRTAHLMLELKAETFPDIERQKRILREHLAGLVPGEDYHIMALDLAIFETFDIVPRDCCLSVALANMGAMSKGTLGTDYGGLTGHYLLLSDAIKRRHEAEGQKVGTGFIASRNCLYREMNRGVEWIFSNHAAALQAIVDGLAADLSPPCPCGEG